MVLISKGCASLSLRFLEMPKGLFGFLRFLSKDKNPYIRSVFKKSNDPKIKEIVEILPSIANAISQGAEAIYLKLLCAQFKDYEERYGCSLLAQINESKKTDIVQTVTGFMLYTFCNKIEAIYPHS